ncbi:MAG: hypothetical protein QNJ68_10350 [Microcoleaceae cyanobacterium MO_207.B10]|nr:hypothetical protein [Microcoleaceae cyanobacterium MO_207.B10]
MGLERISEEISNYFLIRCLSSATITAFDFTSESIRLINLLGGTNHNFNYKLNFLSCGYYIPSLAEKPFQQYKLTDTERDRLNQDIEYSRQYNELTTDESGNPYAVKMTIVLEQNGVSQEISSNLLYNSLTRLHLPLEQYFGSPVMSNNTILKVSCSAFDSQLDKIVLSGSYQGSVNYTFDSGTQSYSHVFP